jgi:accessory secretory protein Asp2
VKLSYIDVLEEKPKKIYDIVFIDRILSDKEVKILHEVTKAYTLFVTENVQLSESMQYYYDCKKGKRIAEEEVQNFLFYEARNYFAKPYGEKYSLMSLSIAHGFSDEVKWNGNYSVTLQGDFGEEFRQIVYWRGNVPIQQGQAIDFWLEYEKDPTVEIALKITQFRGGYISTIQQEWIFSEEQLNDVIVVDNQMPSGPIFVSLQAKGNGKLKIVALHDRYSRRGHGEFLPGGERYVASNREEIFHYFDPGDLKPPLCVYFSGYKTQQGFEGYFMMRSMGCPFLLIAEPRLSGGSFYMGTEEYENACADIIRNRMQELGFSNDQVILSGLSMGTFGALYYGCDILPHAMILGKPLASIGLVAKNERLHRPGGFPTSLDVLNYIIGDTDESAIEKLNNKFWNKFDTTDWGKSKFVVSYMIEDDYDSKAYEMLISHLKADGVQLYGKGIHGRHNDATGGIVAWFIDQYKRILLEDFSRRIEE